MLPSNRCHIKKVENLIKAAASIRDFTVYILFQKYVFYFKIYLQFNAENLNIGFIFCEFEETAESSHQLDRALVNWITFIYYSLLVYFIYKR